MHRSGPPFCIKSLRLVCAQDAAYVALLHPGSDSTDPDLQV